MTLCSTVQTFQNHDDNVLSLVVGGNSNTVLSSEHEERVSTTVQHSPVSHGDASPSRVQQYNAQIGVVE